MARRLLSDESGEAGIETEGESTKDVEAAWDESERCWGPGDDLNERVIHEGNASPIEANLKNTKC